MGLIAHANIPIGEAMRQLGLPLFCTAGPTQTADKRMLTLATFLSCVHSLNL